MAGSPDDPPKRKKKRPETIIDDWVEICESDTLSKELKMDWTDLIETAPINLHPVCNNNRV